MVLRMPEWDLVNDLRNLRDDADATSLECSAINRHLRWYVAVWMLDSAAAAAELYRDSPLLDAPGFLTTASVTAEVVKLWNQKTTR